MAYRFHGANTVWFEDGGRSDYILEVNHVISQALRRIVSHRLETVGAAAAKRELATLLRSRVLRHGESSGFAQLFTDLCANARQTDEDDGDEVDQLVHELMSRKSMASIAGLVEAQPEELVAASRDAARQRVDHCVVEGALHRTRMQHARIERQDGELERRAKVIEDERARAHEANVQRDRVSAELQKTSEQLHTATTDLQATKTKLETTAAELQSAKTELDQLTEQRQVMRTNLRRLEDLRERLRHRAEQRSEALAAEKAALLGYGKRLDDALAVSSGLLAAERERTRALRNSHEWQAGTVLLRRLRLLRPWKTLSRAYTLAAVGARRLVAGNPRPHCAVLAWDGAFPSLENLHLVPEARCLLEGGIAVRIACGEEGDPRLLASAEQPLLSGLRVLPRDGKLRARDRRFFEKRAAPAVAEIDRLYGLEPQVKAQVFTFARSCQSWGGGYLHGLGLGESAALAHGASLLLGRSFGVAVTGPDLPTLQQRRERTTALLNAAAVVVADSERTAAALREATGGLSTLLVKPPATYWESSGEGQPTNDGLRATVATAGPCWELLTIAEAVSRAVNAGADLHIDTLSRADYGRTSGVLAPHVAARGVADRFSFHDDEPGVLASCLARSSVMIATGGSDEQAATVIPTAALAAMAAAVPVVATQGGALDGLVEDGNSGILIPPDDCDALAQALKTLATDPMLRLSLGRRARQRFLRDYAPAVSAAELRDVVRELIERAST